MRQKVIQMLCAAILFIDTDKALLKRYVSQFIVGRVYSFAWRAHSVGLYHKLDA